MELSTGLCTASASTYKTLMKKLLFLLPLFILSSAAFAGQPLTGLIAGQGISIQDPNGPTPTISLGELNANQPWEIKHGGGITLSSPFAFFRMADSDGFFHGTLAATDLKADRWYVFPDASGAVALTTSEISPKLLHVQFVDIPSEDIDPSQCETGEEKIDTGGATVEHCYCINVPGVWYCSPMTQGPID